MSDWLTYSPNYGESGTTQMSVTAAVNPTNASRTKRVVVSDTSGRTASLTVYQAGANAELSLSPTSFNVGAEGGLDNIKYITVTTNSPWRISSAPDWMSFNEVSGLSSTTISFVCGSNNGAVRSGTIVFTNDGGAVASVSVTQSTTGYFSFSVDSLAFPLRGGSSTIRITSSGDWEITGPDWLTYSVTSGTGDANIVVTAADNTGWFNMTGEIIGHVIGGTASDSVSVSQEGNWSATGSVSTTGITAAPSGGTYPVYMRSNVPWTARTDADWIYINPTSGDGTYSSVSIIALQNNTGLRREGHVYFRAQSDNSLLCTVTIWQDPVEGGGGTGAENEYFTVSGTTFSMTPPASGWMLSIIFNNNTATAPTIEVNKNDGGWETKTSYRAANPVGEGYDYYIDLGYLAMGDVMKLRRVVTDYRQGGFSFVVNDSDLGLVFRGNVMSLVYGSNFQGQLNLPCEFCFQGLFAGLGYNGIFDNVVLPATGLTRGCYANMFYNCWQMYTAPELPATTLVEYCYQNMFSGCRGLTTPPELPATVMKDSCYMGMFEECWQLQTAPELPAMTLADRCYYRMFKGCHRLTDMPELPATTMRELCYSAMFWDCRALTGVTALPAMTLARECYGSMFQNCYVLTEAPALPATTLTPYCYAWMFYNCWMLERAPELPATTMVERCYYNMFYDCSVMNYINFHGAYNLSADKCMTNWVMGVAERGTFVKNASVWLPTNYNGIPSGWTVLSS